MDWLNPTGARKVHSLIDKCIKGRTGSGSGPTGAVAVWTGESGGVLASSSTATGALQCELKEDADQPRPVRHGRHQSPRWEASLASSGC